MSSRLFWNIRRRLDREFSNKFLRSIIWVVLITCASITFFSIAEVDPDKAILRSFFSIRGGRDFGGKVQIVAFTKHDMEPPLNLSPKYQMSSEQFQTLLTRILLANPEKIYIDHTILPEQNNDQEKEIVAGLLGSPKVGVYSEEVYEATEPYWARLLNLTHVSDLDRRKASIIITNSTVSRFPKNTSLIQSATSNSLINYYGVPKTIPAITFSDVLVGQGKDLSFLNEKVVFIGRQTSVFIRGQALPKYHETAVASDLMSHLEIQASVFLNALDGSAIRILATKVFITSLAAIFILTVFLMLLSNYWVSAGGFCLFWLGLSTTAYKFFVYKLWWIDGVFLLLFLPLAAFVVHSLSTLFSVNKKDKSTRQHYFLD